MAFHNAFFFSYQKHSINLPPLQFSPAAITNEALQMDIWCQLGPHQWTQLKNMTVVPDDARSWPLEQIVQIFGPPPWVQTSNLRTILAEHQKRLKCMPEGAALAAGTVKLDMFGGQDSKVVVMQEEKPTDQKVASKLPQDYLSSSRSPASSAHKPNVRKSISSSKRSEWLKTTPVERLTSQKYTYTERPLSKTRAFTLHNVSGDDEVNANPRPVNHFDDFQPDKLLNCWSHSKQKTKHQFKAISRTSTSTSSSDCSPPRVRSPNSSPIWVENHEIPSSPYQTKIVCPHTPSPEAIYPITPQCSKVHYTPSYNIQSVSPARNRVHFTPIQPTRVTVQRVSSLAGRDFPPVCPFPPRFPPSYPESPYPAFPSAYPKPAPFRSISPPGSTSYAPIFPPSMDPTFGPVFADSRGPNLELEDCRRELESLVGDYERLPRRGIRGRERYRWVRR